MPPKNRATPLTQKEIINLTAKLTDFMAAQWSLETSDEMIPYFALKGDTAEARTLIESFLEYCNQLKIGPAPAFEKEVVSTFLSFRKILKRVLDVDMHDPANRKGELPKALGLVSSRRAGNYAVHRLIYRGCKYGFEDLGILDQPRAVVADMVAQSLINLQILNEISGEDISTENILKIYDRMLKFELGQ